VEEERRAAWARAEGEKMVWAGWAEGAFLGFLVNSETGHVFIRCGRFFRALT
jgi:hypothetical protein